MWSVTAIKPGLFSDRGLSAAAVLSVVLFWLSGNASFRIGVVDTAVYAHEQDAVGH